MSHNPVTAWIFADSPLAPSNPAPLAHLQAMTADRLSELAKHQGHALEEVKGALGNREAAAGLGKIRKLLINIYPQVVDAARAQRDRFAGKYGPDLAACILGSALNSVNTSKPYLQGFQHGRVGNLLAAVPMLAIAETIRETGTPGPVQDAAVALGKTLAQMPELDGLKGTADANATTKQASNQDRTPGGLPSATVQKLGQQVAAAVENQFSGSLAKVRAELESGLAPLQHALTAATQAKSDYREFRELHRHSTEAGYVRGFVAAGKDNQQKIRADLLRGRGKNRERFW